MVVVVVVVCTETTMFYGAATVHYLNCVATKCFFEAATESAAQKEKNISHLRYRDAAQLRLRRFQRNKKSHLGQHLPPFNIPSVNLNAQIPKSNSKHCVSLSGDLRWKAYLSSSKRGSSVAAVAAVEPKRLYFQPQLYWACAR